MDRGMGSSRREFLSRVAGAGATASFSSLWSGENSPHGPAGRVPIVYFSKHLQWLNWEQMAETAAELGFDELDVTVREGGHVEPARVQEDLPKVAKIVRKAGLEIPMITAGIVDVNSPHAEAIIRTASEVGIPRYRWGWFSWSDNKKVPDLSNFHASIERPSGLLINIPDRLAQLKERVARLAALNEKYKICAMYRNHSGSMVGASVWDLWVKWGRNAKGEWEPLWCPLGEGMVNFPAYLAMISEAKFSGPVSCIQNIPSVGSKTALEH